MRKYLIFRRNFPHGIFKNLVDRLLDISTELKRAGLKLSVPLTVDTVDMVQSVMFRG